MCNRIVICKAFQLLADFMFFCLGILTLSIVLATKNWNIKDPRLTLGQACVELDSDGFLNIITSWAVSLGVAVVLNSVMGSVSCLRGKMWTLYMYSMVSYMLTMLEFLFFFTLYSHINRVYESTRTCFKEVMVRYYVGPYGSDLFNFSGAWDYMHQQFHCCGVEEGFIFNSMVTWQRTWTQEYTDPFFGSSASSNLEEFKAIAVLPYTCCMFRNEGESGGAYNPGDTAAELTSKLLDAHCPIKPTAANSYINRGCFPILNTFLQDMSSFIFVMSIAAELLQFLACVSALYTSRATQNMRLQATMKRKGLIY